MQALQLSRWLSGDGGGGIQAYLASVSGALKCTSVSVCFAALMPGTLPEFSSGICRVGDDGSKLLNALKLWRWMARNRKSFDLIHIHGVTDWHFVIGFVFCRWYSLPCVVTAHGGLLQGALDRIGITGGVAARLYLRRVLPFLLSRVQVAVASSCPEARSIGEITKSVPVKIIPPSILIPSQSPSFDQRPSSLRILYLGRIAPIKSLETLVTAVAMLSSKGLEVGLDVVGCGEEDYVYSIKQLAERYSVAKLIIWHGYLSGQAKLAIIRSARLLVLPSISENFGFVVAEAMAAGRPVVISDGVALCEMVRSYDAGSVFAVGSAPELSSRIISYADDKFWEAKARHAFDCARREFSLQAMGSMLEAAYHDATAQMEAHR